MPLYLFACRECGVVDERLLSVAVFKQSGADQRCQVCEGQMDKRMGVPTLRCDTEFMAGSNEDDGLPDSASRKTAYAKARAAGVNIQGKKFHPGLCRRGKPFDPEAWYGGREEVVAKTEALGRVCSGTVNHESPIRDEDFAAAEAPYRVAPDIVQPYVAQEIQQEHGGRASPAKVRELTEKYQDKHSGSPAEPKPVNLFE